MAQSHHQAPDLQRVRFNKLHRADWREVLQSRDQKRAARRASIARRQSRRMHGHISRTLILCLILTCALAMGLTAWDVAQRAARAIVSHQV